jgi:arylsulfatase A-like enzyme
MIDDLGWTDLHCQGNNRLETPNIDRLALQGMRFTDGYAAAPVCSPTRAAIMTGQSPARLAITNHLPDQKRFEPDNATLRSAGSVDHLSPDYVTIAERLKEAGYANAFIGKWHLSGRREEMSTTEPARRPEQQGFDLNVGGCCFGGPPSYFSPYKNPAIQDGTEGEYLTERLADEAIDFMRKHQAQPFFIALWNYTVHWPMQAPQELIDKYKTRPGLKDHRYAAMIEAMDTQIGRVLESLDALKLADNTLVIFTSDNGAFGGVTDLHPLRGCKGYLYEGGIRVPLIVRWPGQVKPGTICTTPVISTDFYPTILDVAGLKAKPGKPLDGESIVPLIRQKSPLQRRAIYFHYPNYAFHRGNRLGGAIREGDYKLIEYYDDGSVELYNLSKDVGEQHDLSQKLPQKARDMKEKLDQWLRTSGARMPERIDHR